MLNVALLAPLFALSVGALGGNSNRHDHTGGGIGYPEPSTLPEITWTVLYADSNVDSDTVWDPPSELGGGSAVNYCTAGVNSFNTMAIMSHVGTLTLSDNSFGLQVSGAAAITNSWGIFTYGLNQFNAPFGNGTLCISPFPPGIYKMPTQHLGNGTVVRTKAAHPADFALFTPAHTWNFQFWYRDPPAGGANFNLSDGLHVTFAP